MSESLRDLVMRQLRKQTASPTPAAPIVEVASVGTGYGDFSAMGEAMGDALDKARAAQASETVAVAMASAAAARHVGLHAAAADEALRAELNQLRRDIVEIARLVR